MCASCFFVILFANTLPQHTHTHTHTHALSRSFLCTYPLVGIDEDFGSGLAPCTGQLTMFTDWHKTSSLSSVAMSFWTSMESWFTDNDVEILEDFDIIAPVITGTTGAWPKVGAFSNVAMEFELNEMFPFILNIAYKVGAP